jgi:hypothetical protein
VVLSAVRKKEVGQGDKNRQWLLLQRMVKEGLSVGDVCVEVTEVWKLGEIM